MADGVMQFGWTDNGTLTLVYEDQVFNETTGAMDHQRLGELTLSRENWERVVREVSEVLADPQRREYEKRNLS